MSAAEEVVTRSPEVLAERVAGEIVLLDPASDRYMRLNGTGAVLWEALAEPATIGALASALVDAAGIDSDRAADDARAFVAELLARGLVDVNRRD